MISNINVVKEITLSEMSNDKVIDILEKEYVDIKKITGVEFILSKSGIYLSQFKSINNIECVSHMSYLSKLEDDYYIVKIDYHINYRFYTCGSEMVSEQNFQKYFLFDQIDSLEHFKQVVDSKIPFYLFIDKKLQSSF